MFNQMLEAIGHKNIRVIRGSWASEGLMTTNYEVYMKNLATTTMCESEAALATPTGKWATRNGFGAVQDIKAIDGEIVVEFMRRGGR